jgi:hypothetical protein
VPRNRAADDANPRLVAAEVGGTTGLGIRRGYLVAEYSYVSIAWLEYGDAVRYRMKKRALSAEGPRGAWVTIDDGVISVKPDNWGIARVGEVVQRTGEVILIRAKYQPRVFNSCMLVRGNTETGARAWMGVKLGNHERLRVESILTAAGFHVVNRVTSFSIAADIARIMS